MLFWTTLRLLRKHHACQTRYPILRKALGPKYGQDTPISLLFILESNGVDDCLWELQNNHEDQPDREQVRRILAAGFAEHVLPLYERQYPGDMRPRIAVETACLHAFGLATSDEIYAARAAAWDAAGAAGAATWKTIQAAAEDVSRDATWAAAWIAARAVYEGIWGASGATSEIAEVAARKVAKYTEREWQAGYIRHVLAWAEARKLGILKEESDGR